MIAVLFATDGEARPLMDRVDAEPRDDAVCPIFTGHLDGVSLVIAISGVGVDAARAACRHVLRRYQPETVVNVGICGALDDALAPGDVLGVTAVVDGDRCEEASCVRRPVEPWPGLPARTLGTVSEPVFGTARRDMLARHASLVDMEGIGVVQECQRRGVPCVMLKGVSDRACAQGRDDIRRHLDTVSQRLAERFSRDVRHLHFARDTTLSRLSRFTRVEHTVFSLPLLFAGAWLGAGHRFPAWRTLGLIVVVGTGARMFGMAMNRILDRDLDARNPRTAQRELPTGRLSLWHAYAVAGLGLTAYLAGCAALNPLCLYLAPVPLIPLAAYALLKRFTVLCHFGIGLCLALAPLGAFVAAAGRLPWQPDVLLLAMITLLWMSGFDIIYALQDIAADRLLGVKSLPAALGSTRAQAVAGTVHGLCVVLLAWLWVSGGGHPRAGVALGVALLAFAMAYNPRIPLPRRFFPLSAVAGGAAALVVFLNGSGG